jgi:hypothetical protein
MEKCVRAVGVWLAASAMAVVLAAPARAAAADVTGTWSVSVHADGPHRQMSASLTLTQDGRTVTGTLAAHGNEHALTGAFVDGTLTLEATGLPEDKAITLTATLQGDGTLSGYLSGPMGDLKWTATRAKGQA